MEKDRKTLRKMFSHVEEFFTNLLVLVRKTFRSLTPSRSISLLNCVLRFRFSSLPPPPSNKFSFAFECKLMREGAEGDNLIYWKCIPLKFILLCDRFYCHSLCSFQQSSAAVRRLPAWLVLLLKFFFFCIHIVHMELFVMIKF